MAARQWSLVCKGLLHRNLLNFYRIYSCIIAGLKNLMHMAILHFISERQSRDWKRSISKKGPSQINWLPQQCSLSVCLIILSHAFLIKAQYVVKIGQARSAIIGRYAHFCSFFSHKMSKRFSEVIAPNLTKFVHTFNVLLSCQLVFRYSNPFQSGSAPMKTPILWL